MEKAQKSYRTKQLLSENLKRLLKEDPIEKVRIHDLTEPCHIHRQSFYYHFEDINGLLCWSACQDIENWLSANPSGEPWPQRLLYLLHDIEENRNYYRAVLDSPACGNIQSLFREKITRLLLMSAAKDGGTLTAQEHAHIDTQASIVHFLLDQWVRGVLKLSPEEIVRFIEAQLAGASGAVPDVGELPQQAHPVRSAS